jgi:hypothetical protein
VTLVLQVAFIIYSLFSVDAFTLYVQEIVGRDPPMGLPTSYRATLLVIFVMNTVASAAALLLSVVVLRVLGRVQAQPWWQRRLEEQSSSAQALLAHGPGTSTGSGPGRVAPPTSVQLTGSAKQGASGAGQSGLHMPTLQRPSGAALL